MSWFRKNAVKIQPPPVKFRIPPKIAKNYLISGDLSNVANWKAKIILCNSGSKGKKVGQWDEVGYVLISLDSDFIVPVARADEHWQGHELFRKLSENNMVPDEDFVSVYVTGNNYVYKDQDQKFLAAMKKYVAYGGKNGIIEGDYGSNRMYMADVASYIAGEGSLKVDKGQISVIAQSIFQYLTDILQKVQAKNPSVFRAAHSFTCWMYDRWPVLKMVDLNSMGLDLRTAIDNAEAKQDFHEIERLFFAHKGVKSQLHMTIRGYLDGSQSEYAKEETEKFWGNVEKANIEINRLRDY